MIFAMDKNRVIGKDNQIPWRLPAEQQYFKQVTMGHPIIMGRKTYESIGRPLPGRVNVVITRDEDYEAPGCEVLHSAETAVSRYNEEDPFIIGGAELIRSLFPLTDRLYITEIDHEFDGDTFFPEIDSEKWRLVSRTPGITDERNPYVYHYLIYEVVI